MTASHLTSNTTTKIVADSAELPKACTGMTGFDEVTGGGLPAGRPTLVSGAAGCGKTLFAMQFLVNGATQFDEPGVFISFEESEQDLIDNVRSLGWDLETLIEQEKFVIDYVHIEMSEIEETGEYNLDGLFIRLEMAIETIGAKRVALDTIEALFAGLSNVGVVRTELRRLFRWLKEKGVTVVITGEPGVNTLTRHGLEEYVSDCVIALDHRLIGQIATRHLRVLKYRGSAHGTNEYPFLIEENGISVLPITSVDLSYEVSEERISTGIAALDDMLGGKGYYRSSTILVSGTTGTGKSSMAAHLIDAACRRGERCLYFVFEEPVNQVVRNMRSIGVDLQPWLEQGLLRIQAERPTVYGLELHLATTFKLVREYQPHIAIMDPVSSLLSLGQTSEISSVVIRVVDFLKMRGCTAFMIDLTPASSAQESSQVDISSLVDTWILLRDIESGGERNRALYVLKSRGMAHSNQIREFVLNEQGIHLTDVYLGPEGVLTGTAREAQVTREETEAIIRQREIETKKQLLEHKRRAMEAEIEALRNNFLLEQEKLQESIAREQLREQVAQASRDTMARMRRGDNQE